MVFRHFFLMVTDGLATNDYLDVAFGLAFFGFVLVMGLVSTICVIGILDTSLATHYECPGKITGRRECEAWIEEIPITDGDGIVIDTERVNRPPTYYVSVAARETSGEVEVKETEYRRLAIGTAVTVSYRVGRFSGTIEPTSVHL